MPLHMHLAISYVMMAAAINNQQSVPSMHLNVYEHVVFTDMIKLSEILHSLSTLYH